MLGLFAFATSHPITRFKFPSKAFAKLMAAQKEIAKYKTSLIEEGKYGCCIKKPSGGCNMCAAQTGSCACAANLAAGKGTCGECFAGWANGRGSFDLKAMGINSPADILILPAAKQGIEGVQQDKENAHLKKYKLLMVESKKIMVGEKRFNCCVGQGGCDECAQEQYCGCSINLVEDMKKKPGQKKDGICGQCIDGQHGGHGRVAGVDLKQHVHPMRDDMGAMKGVFTTTMSQESSGTSWLPASSPMHMRMLGNFGGWEVNFMGLGTANWVDAGGDRGESQAFANSMMMFMAQRENWQIRFMGSLDPLTSGKEGYPDLFQTGETAFGEPLKDRQHPHDGIMELAVTYSFDIGAGRKGFLYFAPVGEPAMGTAAFQHRPSAWEMPEAPINHHWNDGTHISSGVVTAGVNITDRWKIEGSLFTGREPDENRWDIDPIKLDSAGGRLTFNPSNDWSLSASYGFLKNPEALEEGDQHRLVLSAFHQRGDWSLGAIWSRNYTGHGDSDAVAIEGTYSTPSGSLFGRFEMVEKDELVDVPKRMP
ncbi:MAG: hypothetical protein H7Y17_07675 [Chlorobia bacterium]|nr:hypothetical protein [Fimbriimonadaceae bacterium]